MDTTVKRKRWGVLSILFIFVLTTTGCAGYRETKRLVLLDDISLLYEQALMTGRYRAANNFVKSDNKDRTPDFELLKNIQVSAYELIEKDASSGSMKALITVEIRYFHVHYFVEKVIIDEQQWEFDPDENNWYLTSGLPDFK